MVGELLLINKSKGGVGLVRSCDTVDEFITNVQFFPPLLARTAWRNRKQVNRGRNELLYKTDKKRKGEKLLAFGGNRSKGREGNRDLCMEHLGEGGQNIPYLYT